MTGRSALLISSPRRRGRGPLLRLTLAVANMVAVLGATAAPAHAQSLAQAVAMALQTNPRVLGAQTAAQAVSHDITGAQSQ
ncbi:MAG TPA: hypothetical protein VEY69_12265, partial [Lautropia sp.]|nr:hypothetical protein [Lautropia sp.]